MALTVLYVPNSLDGLLGAVVSRAFIFAGKAVPVGNPLLEKTHGGVNGLDLESTGSRDSTPDTLKPNRRARPLWLTPPSSRNRFRAKRKQPKTCWGLSPERQGQNLALTVLYVPYSLRAVVPRALIIAGKGRSSGRQPSSSFFFFITLKPRVE